MADDFFPNQTIIERAIIRKIDGTEIDLLEQNQGNTPFFRLIMKESMFEPMVSGTLFVQDKNSAGEKLNFVGGEIFEISIKTPLSGADSDLEFSNDEFDLVSQQNLQQNLRFYIFRVKSLTDEATVEVDSEKGPATMWNLDFGPYELIYFNKTEAPLYGGEFIGKIADGEGDGLVDYFADRYFNPSDLSTCQEPMDIEPTLNSIWFKGNHASYPYGKDNPYLELGRLMNYLSEYSVSGENASGVNYMFWQDLKRWHFRSVDSLIKGQGNPARTYKVSIDKNGRDKVQNFRIVKQIDQSELINSNAYKSFYTSVEPNYNDLYSDYMPTNDKLVKSKVDYDYRTDYESWSHIEENPLLPSSLDYEDGNSNEIHDDVHGWFNLGEYNDQFTTKFDFLANENSKSDIKAWQTNFDMTDLDAELLKKIRFDVINPAKENYSSYVRRRLLKEKWNIYKYSICCDKQAVAAVATGGGARILGWITGFERYSLPEDNELLQFRHIWKYTWEPVEVWLKDEVYNLDEIDAGNTYDVVAKQGPFAVVKIPQAQGVTLEAWNLNELNNDTEVTNAIFPEYLGPGYFNNNLYGNVAGPSSSPTSRLSTSHYVPIGGFILRSHDQVGEVGDPSSLDNPTFYNTCSLKNAGQLVELFEIPTSLSILGITGSDENTAPSETIYVFDAQNAIDQACVPCLLETEIVEQ